MYQLIRATILFHFLRNINDFSNNSTLLSSQSFLKFPLKMLTYLRQRYFGAKLWKLYQK